MADTDSPSPQGSGAAAGRDIHITAEGFAAGRDVNARDISYVANHYYGPVPGQPVRLLRTVAGRLVGRGKQFAELRSLLDPERDPSPLVNVSNGPACGKTYLAEHVALAVAELFPGAQLFLEMTGPGFVLDTGAALRRLLTDLGVTDSGIPEDVRARADLLRRTLPDGSLLVLDNVMTAEQVADLLPRHPSCAVLMTSRSSLQALEGLIEVDLGRMPESEARDLFAELIGAARATAEPEAVRTIVELCGGLPLALHIAAAQLRRPSARREPVETFAGRLRRERDRLNMLKTGHLDLRASFELSYQSLSEPAARLFRLMGWIQVPDFSREFAEAVDGTADGPDAFDELFDAYLAEDTGTGRTRFHDLLSVFAQERAQDKEDPGSRDAALGRAIAWCAEQAALLGGQVMPVDQRVPGTLSDAEALAALDAERDVMLTVIRRAAAEGYGVEPLLITSRLGSFFEVRGAWDDWLEAAELSVMSAERSSEPQMMAEALLQRSWPLRLKRRTSQAISDDVAALRLLDGLPAGTLRGEILSHLGTLYREAHRYDEADQALTEAIEIFRATGDPHSEGLALRTLGHAQARRMDLAAAQSTLERAVTLLEQTGDRVGEGWSRNNLCRVFGDMWRYDDAAHQHRKALEIFTDLGSPQGQAWSLNHMARVSGQYGRTADVIDYGERALAIFEALNDKYGTGWALLHLAAARQDAEQARRALASFTAMSDPEEDGQGWTLVTLARLLGDAALAEEALGHFAVVGSLRGEGNALAARGDLEREAGQLAEAERSYDSALPALERGGDIHRAALVRLALAGIARQSGDETLARNLEQTAQTALTAFDAPEAGQFPGKGHT